MNSIDLNHVSPTRLARISNSETMDEASSMGFIDRILDFFRGGIKKESIEAIYTYITTIKSDASSIKTQDRLHAFLDMRDMALPEHRSRFTIDSSSDHYGNISYALKINGEPIYEESGIPHAKDMFKSAENYIKVTDFLDELQDRKPGLPHFVASSDELKVRQGQTGDCYALATMIGIFSNPIIRKKIQDTTEITPEGRLRLEFDALPDGSMTQRGSSSDNSIGLFLKRKENIEYLQLKGFHASILNNGKIQLDIDIDALERIIKEKRSALTNSLIFNIVEHFVGNIVAMQYKDVVDHQKGASRISSRTDPQLEEWNTVFPKSDSIIAHSETRLTNYDPLVANLFGYESARIHQYDITNYITAYSQITHDLDAFDHSGQCLSNGCGDFIYVGCDYGLKDAHGRFHSRHALILDSVSRDMNKNIVGIHLVNPWDNTKTEYLSINDIIARKPVFVSYALGFTPDASESQLPPAYPNYQLFAQ